MKALKDRSLFVSIRDYLGTYLPRVRCRSAETVRSSMTALDMLVDFFELVLHVDVFSLTTKDLTQTNIHFFVDWLVTERGNMPSTANQRLSRVKAFLGYLIRHCDPSDIAILAEVKDVLGFPEVTDDVPKSLSIEQVRFLLNAPDMTIPLELRDAVFMTLL